METLEFIWNCCKVALGIGFVIFVHELGHFLLAKWNGVKVTKFSIGFGPTLVSFRRGVGLRIGMGSRPKSPDDPQSYGETEYVVAALPLGGFVLMSGEGVEGIPDSSQEERPVDPRDYRAKPVGARMAIITAGVIMNVILAWACFTLVYTQGTTDRSAKVGGVVAGSPAYKAGLREGDEIVGIDGRRNPTYKQVLNKILSSVARQAVKFTVKRPGVEGEQTFPIESRREPGSSTPTVGFYPASSLNLFSEDPYLPLPGQAVAKDRAGSGFVKGDRLTAMGPEGGPMEPVADFDDFLRKSQALRDRPMVVEVERVDPKVIDQGAPKRVNVTVLPHRFVEFGLRMTTGPVVAIRPGSPAQKAGLQPGDQIVAVGGRKDFDPLRLPDEILAAAGKPLVLSVARTEPGQPSRTIELSVTPDDSPIWVAPVSRFANAGCFDIPGLGLALQVDNKVAAVVSGSPASKAGLKPGDPIRSMVLTPDEGEKSKSKPKPITLTFDADNKGSAWPTAFARVQDIPWTSVELTVNDSPTLISVKPEVDLDNKWYHPLRGLDFLELTKAFPPLGLQESARRGAEETWENAAGIVSIFQNLAQRRVGGDAAFNGVIPIARVAYHFASTGFVSLVQFLGLISINLAVLNFLPIPPLDGGQFVFLLAEKIKGKPLPESWLNVGTLAGVILVLFLMLAVNLKDLFQLVQSYF